MNLVTNKRGELLTTSKVIADSFGKIHRDVMRSIKNLDCSDDFRVRNFAQSSYLSPQNKTLECFDITRDGFAFLCMGFTGKYAAAWKEKYIFAFNTMETALNNPPLTMATLNDLTRKIESDKDVASYCGKELANYKKVKKENSVEWEKTVSEVQSSFGFK